MDRVTLSTLGDTVTSHMVWGIDGKPRKSTLRLVGQDTELSSVLSWDGNALMIRTTSSSGGGDLAQTDTWTYLPMAEPC